MALLNYSYALFAVLGFLLSVYSVVVEHKATGSSDDTYSAYCDVSDKISCSAVLTSEFSVGFGLIEKFLGKDHIFNQPNSYYGVLFYPVQLLLSVYLTSKVIAVTIMFINTMVCFISLYLIYILAFVMEKVCLVCMGIHVVNFILLICNCLILNTMPTLKRKAD